jgi:prevent-host-death family protein
MQQTMSITDVRKNFPALVRQLSEGDEPIVVTNRNRPQAVLIGWETFERQERNNIIAGHVQLTTIVGRMVKLAGGLEEAHDATSVELQHGAEDLLIMARQAWETSRSLPEPYPFLATLIADALENLLSWDEPITREQLATLYEILPLLSQETLEMAQVRSADLALLNVNLNAVAPMGDELTELYE